jgi:hypothetical protein
MSKGQLTKLYSESQIDGEEFLTFMLAMGATDQEASKALAAAHADAGHAEWPHPDRDIIEPGLPDYAGPKRAARRPPKRASELRGHPLD